MEKTCYGIASLGDTISYGFIGTFCLFFLTTIADIPPAIAGVIVALGSIWNSVFNPVMGYISDNISTRFGRRRPVIFIFSIFLGITLFLMFTDVNMPSAVKSVYYGVMMVLFWTSFTGFFIPYSALGTDYASSYDETTSIRSFASFFNMVGNLFCMVMPTIMVDFLESRGMTDAHAWSATGAFLGIVTSVSILVTVATSKKQDLPCSEGSGKVRIRLDIKSIFSEYLSVAKLKPMKYLIAASMFSLIIYTILMSNVIYYFTYNLELSAGQISLFLMIRSLLGIAFIPLAAFISARADKRLAIIGFYVTGIAGMIFIRFTEPAGLPGALIYTIFLTICTTIYWQMVPSLFYDICQYDRITTGKKREAMVLSIQGLVEAFAAGIGGQILGLVLQASGFDGSSAVQSGTALFWIENSATVMPMVFLALACVALYLYPLRRKHFSSADEE